MNLFLNNPALIWLLALAIIPFLVHLLAKSRPPEHKFSDITFLKNIIKKSSRYRKPKDRLVLILRTLAAAALIFAFLQPLLVSKAAHSLANTDKTTIFIIDQSASMAASESSTTRFSTACNEAAAIISKTNPDAANIIWINATPDGIFPAPGPNLDFLIQKLQQTEHTPEQGAITPAIKLAIDQLKNVTGNREIILISDFQKLPWQNAEIFIPESIKFTKIPVGKTNLPNIAIESLTTFPPSPVSSQNVAITARIKNHSDSDKSTTIYLNAGGGRQSKQIEIPANGQTEAEFITQFTHAGDVAVTATLTEDMFREDDERHTIIPVRENLKLLSISDSSSTSTTNILNRLAAALPWLTHTTSDQLPTPGVCDVLFIHHWNGQDIDHLTELSNNGTSIIVSPATNCPLTSLQQLLDLAPVQAKLNLTTHPEGRKAAMAKESAAVFSIFSSGEFGNPAQGSFRQRYELPTQWNNTAIINYTDDIPAIIITKKSSASRLIWNLTFDPDHSDWISQEPFVTFMAELLLNIQPTDSSIQNELLPGTPVNWLVPENIDAKTLKLKTSSGQELETEIFNTAQGTSLQSKTPATPGIYQWLTGASAAHKQFVNFPTSESDLTLISPDEIPTGDTTHKEDILRAEALAQGIPTWPWLVGATLILLIAEALAASTPKKIST
ncbi:MAG: vWA domain-containing protein [Akkermansiaceae bacterium]